MFGWVFSVPSISTYNLCFNWKNGWLWSINMIISNPREGVLKSAHITPGSKGGEHNEMSDGSNIERGFTSLFLSLEIIHYLCLSVLLCFLRGKGVRNEVRMETQNINLFSKRALLLFSRLSDIYVFKSYVHFVVYRNHPNTGPVQILNVGKLFRIWMVPISNSFGCHHVLTICISDTVVRNLNGCSKSLPKKHNTA